MGYFSNGTEHLLFEEAWCANCIHSDHSGGREIGVNPPCPVMMAHSLYAYELCNEKDHPGKVILDMLMPRKQIPTKDGIGLDVNECSMFAPLNDATPGQTSLI